MDAERLRFDDARFDAKSPFLTTLPQAFGAFYPPPPMDPNAPGPFRFAPPGALKSVIRKAGFAPDPGVRLARGVLGDRAGLRARAPVKLDGLPAPDRERLRERVREATMPYMDGECVRLVATPLCASGRK